MRHQALTPVVIFASGGGSNFEAIYTSIIENKLKAEVKGVISDQPKAPVLEKAERLGIPTACIPLLRDRKRHEQQILEAVGVWKPFYVILAGYMRILSSDFVHAFWCDRGYARIVNIHPSLLPSFPGMYAYRQAFRYGAKVSGVSVHLVDAQVDHGPICAQEAFSIANCQTEEECMQRGQTIEHQLYPETLKWILPEEFYLESRFEGRFCVRKN